MRQRLVLAAGLLTIAVAALWALAQDAPRRAGTNNVRPGGEVVRLPPGGEACQPEDVPPSTRSVAVWARPRGTSLPPRLAVTVRAADGSEVRGRSRGPLAADGATRIALPRSPSPGGAELCLSNRGRAGLSLLGVATAAPSRGSGSPRKPRSAGAIGVDYYRGGSETWLQLAPTVADRFALGKPGFFGGWTLWLALAAVIGAWACAVVAIGGSERTR